MAGARYSSFFASTPSAAILCAVAHGNLSSSAQTVRAILLASATVTSMRGYLLSICSSQESRGAPRLAACSTTALEPRISSRLSVRSPIFEIAPSFCLPPVER